MATEKEAGFPIEGFGGINRNVDREDLLPDQLYSAQNLWEKTLGLLETRGASEALTGSLPSNIIGLGRNFRIYKNQDEKVRFCAIQCDPDIQELNALPAGVALSFVTDASAYWNADTAFGAGYGATTFNFTHRYILLRFVGYGVDYWYEVAVTDVTDYAAATKQKLRVVVSQAQNSNITGIEVYAVVKCGNTETVATVTASSGYNQMTMWCGLIDLVSSSTGTFDFMYSPYSYDNTIAANTTIAGATRTFVAEGRAEGSFGVTGSTLEAGKTYYVAVLPQYAVFSANPDSRCCYRNPTASVWDSSDSHVIAVTIPGQPGDTGYINISGFNLNTVAYIVAIGESPQLLQPVKLFNNGRVDSSENITSIPVGNPAVVDIGYTADGVANLIFRASDYSHHDMLMGIEDDGSVFPIFVTRLHEDAQLDTTYIDWIGNFVDIQTFRYYLTNAIAQVHRLGDGHDYQFESWQDLCFFVSTWNPNLLPSATSYTALDSRTETNYYMTDGRVGAAVIEDYQATPRRLPCCHYIKKFDSSIVLGGGVRAINPATLNTVDDPSKTLYFSRALNPYDFTIAGAASTTHQTVSQDEDGEDINGLGIFTNTTVDTGPQSHLITSKKNALWSLNQLPVVDSGALDLTGVKNTILSKKAGSVGHNTFVNTPIGLIVAANDNVYLVRESGEPAPIGQNLYGLLRDADFSKASACYHDKHYKLSFYHPDYSGTAGYNNVEVWLNINKMIELKGKEDWVGPMIGRAIFSSFVEDRAGDGLTYSSARDRLCVDQENLRVFKADVEPDEGDTEVLDFATAVTAEFATKDFTVAEQDNNWNKLLKRTYWKLKTNMTSGAPLSYTEKTYVDGALVETKSAQAYGTSSVDFSDQPLKLNGVFPASRQRGRTLRKVFTTAKRIGIAGFQINYTVERRRI